VDVCWLEQNARDVPAGDWWLSETELSHLDRLHIPKRRDDWRLGRWTAKHAVAIHLNLARNGQGLRTVELRATPSGAPEVFLHSRVAPIQLSLSHSAGVGLCAVARAGAGLGCDLELVEPRSPVFVTDYFTAEEQALVAATPSALRDQLVTLLWSTKESVLKAVGCGLRSDTRSVNAAPSCFSQGLGDEWNSVSAQASGRIFYGWWRISRNVVRTIVADLAPRRLVEIRPRETA